jgi:hypothetical protein
MNTANSNWRSGSWVWGTGRGQRVGGQGDVCGMYLLCIGTVELEGLLMAQERSLFSRTQVGMVQEWARGSAGCGRGVVLISVDVLALSELVRCGVKVVVVGLGGRPTLRVCVVKAALALPSEGVGHEDLLGRGAVASRLGSVGERGARGPLHWVRR